MAALARLCSWIERCPDLLPGQGTYKSQPVNAQIREQQIDVSLSLSLSLSEKIKQ